MANCPCLFANRLFICQDIVHAIQLLDLLFQTIYVDQPMGEHHLANRCKNKVVGFDVHRRFLHFLIGGLLQLLIVVNQKIVAIPHSLADGINVVPLQSQPPTATFVLYFARKIFWGMITTPSYDEAGPK